MSYPLSRYSFVLVFALVVLFALPAVADACGTPAKPNDLAITKTGPSFLVPGQQTSYNIQIRQVATAEPNFVVVTETFSPALIPVSKNVLGFNCFQAGSAFSCQYAAAPAFKGPATLNFTFRVAPDAVCGSTVVNKAYVSSFQKDLNEANNDATVTSTVVNCATPTPSITPRPTPTPAPTPAPTPTPTPTPELNKGIHVVKTDNREITRPGHSLTYAITVQNTGEADLHDVKITDTVPEKLKVTGIDNGGVQSGRTITWSNLALESGQKKRLTFTATVALDTKNGHVLDNDVKACSADHDICDEASDTTRVERIAKVAAIVVEKPVPVTAPTGPTSALMSLAFLLLGAGGLTYLQRQVEQG
jgi:uncharacterized repeat protein (TIGR01451 family)